MTHEVKHQMGNAQGFELADIRGDVVCGAVKGPPFGACCLLQAIVGEAIHNIELLQRPPFDLGEGCQSFQPGLYLFCSSQGELGIGGNWVPAIGIAGGALQGAAALTPDPDGRMGVLHRFGEKIEIVKLTVLSLERRVRARPRLERRQARDLSHRLNGFLPLRCTCGLEIKVPPDYERNEIRCVRCGSVLPVG